MSIRILSDETINKIAAGEVVENPASVVKEVIENAIDAKATNIVIEINGGGFSLIRVSDNGVGMNRDDLILSLERHATSKIKNSDDINDIQSMGFRGEALASIGSVSKLRLTSCHSDSKIGAQIECNGGQLTDIKEKGHPQGTTLEIYSLFFNVPARKKFQKSKGASQAEIYKTVIKLALANLHCDFKYIVEGKLVFHLCKDSLKCRAKELLGINFLKGVMDVEFEENSLNLTGFIGSPTEARTNRLGQYLFVNKRAVLSPEINRAIYEAYGTRIGSYDHPTYVLHLTLPPEWIDVNVHPQKTEIRIQKDCRIHESIRDALLMSFQGKSFTRKSFPKVKPIDWGYKPLMRMEKVQEQSLSNLNFEEAKEEIPVIGMFDHFLLIDGKRMKLNIPMSDSEDGIILVDLKRAQFSLLFNKFLSSGEQQIEGLIVPYTLEFSPHEFEILTLHLQEIKKMGIDMRPFGNQCYIVDALSSDIPENQLKPLLNSLIEVFDEKIAEKEMKKKLALTLSNFAKSQKKTWTIIEAKYLFKELLKIDSPYLCPKGKPNLVHINYETITGYFKKAY